MITSHCKFIKSRTTDIDKKLCIEAQPAQINENDVEEITKQEDTSGSCFLSNC